MKRFIKKVFNWIKTNDKQIVYDNVEDIRKASCLCHEYLEQKSEKLIKSLNRA